MKFLSFREFRNNPGQVRRLVRRDDLVLTVNGKPLGVLLAIENDDLDRTLALVRRARAQVALSRIRTASARKGLDRLSLDEVNAEVRAERAKRVECLAS